MPYYDNKDALENITSRAVWHSL